DTQTLAHLFKYDSVHGPYPGTVTATGDTLNVDGQVIRVFKEPSPENLPWKALGVHVVIESTGKFTSAEKAAAHLRAGARQVLISAPSPDNDVPTAVSGVNDAAINLRATLWSNGSCTTNNLAPLVKVLDEHCGIENGYITTVHSITGDQNLND